MLAPLLLAGAVALASAPARPASVPHDDVPYLIVTSAALRDSFAPLADWRTRTGTPAWIVTMEDIVGGAYPGRDPAEKLRHYLRSMHDDWHTHWVLLGGDATQVPARLVSVDTGVPGLPAQTFASDGYFACLGGDWDANANGVFGEVPDAPDLTPWLAVGRAPVRSPEEAGRFVRKTLRYARTPNAHYLPEGLVAVSSFGNYFPPAFGRALASPITQANPLAHVRALLQTTPMFPLDTLQPGEAALTFASAMAALNAGPHLALLDAPTDTATITLDPYAGGPITGNAHTADFRALGNGDHVMHLVQFSGVSLFGPDGLGNGALLAENGGAVSVCGGTATTLIGASTTAQRAYLTLLAGGGIPRVGDAFLHARDTLRVSLGGSLGQLTHELMALLGDPALAYWRKAPQPIAATATRAPGSPGEIVRVSAPGAAGACVVVTADGAWLAQGTTGADGGAALAIPPGTGSVLVTLSGDGLAPLEIALASPAGAGADAPASLAFAAPSPNPARGSVSFAWRAPGDSRLDVFDASGRLVRAWRLAGTGARSVPWDLRDGTGRAVGAGLYFARVASGAATSTQRVLVLQ